MNFRVFLEWDEQTGISYSKLYPMVDGIEAFFREHQYGTSINEINALLILRGYDFKQRKRFKKDEALFTYDILLDYFLIKNVSMDEKKAIIRRQIVEITEATFSKYKFDDFNKQRFLSDLKTSVGEIQW
ncbi:hypothetical protein LZZ85_13060 [Terrimonas sp. NA20]|uniref:Uncharacterized protein n=1 Tax=Terrimonas ginsenosidimutans TaxID=2908004 RepID=A0ABS9KSE6_9BACT|nr:hypothetical protein [Terrimonas ginsenosidimutans]MCG2615223.1 hypothetical protein [Terrimonas ginsenosidimutans]